MRFVVFLLLLIPSTVLAQKVALSFDDGFNPLRQPQAKLWNQQILEHLKNTQTTAIFYVTGRNVNSPEGLKLVRDWGEQGHNLANHTYSHQSLHSSKVDWRDYVKDMEKNHNLLKDFPGWTNRFRFPYLKEGKVKAKRDGARKWLKDNQYASGAVSIDSSDWYYNQHYLKLKAKNDTAKIALIRDAYLEHLWGRAQYYDGLSNKVLKRSVGHVLLLHVNAINAAFLSDVVKMFRDKGWQMITPEKAYQDKIYHQQIDVLPAGESILWQLGKQNGLANLRYPGEDSRYERAKIDALLQ